MTNMVKFDPFTQMQALQRQFFGDDMFTPTTALAQFPVTDVYTVDDDHLVVEVHLPNFTEADVDIQLDGNVLIVSAEHHEEESKGKKGTKKYMVRESSSSFYRTVHLPELANKEAITADMKAGVLTVTVPFKELPKPKKISVRKQ